MTDNGKSRSRNANPKTMESFQNTEN